MLASFYRIMLVVAAALAVSGAASAQNLPAAQEIRRLDGRRLSPEDIDREVDRLMKRGQVPGLALALLHEGRPVYVKAYGLRNVLEKSPLQNDTIMYGASLTKLVFAHLVMQLIDEKMIELDRPLAEYLMKPLPEYAKYADLADDPRWKSLTARMMLSHTTGFPNFRFLNPDEKLDFKFDPGARYAYSGEGYNLLQFVLEEGLRLDVGQEMQRRVFDPFGMKRTCMTWRVEFKANMADGYDKDGKGEGHHVRRNVRAAGSMDTTVADYAKFLAGFMRGEGLSRAAKAEMLRPQIEIMSAHQFPTLEMASDPANRKIKLAAALGSVVYEGPYGRSFYKGGHDDWTGNLAVCVEGKGQCILLMSNSVRAEAVYPVLVKAVFGESGLPWSWEYNPASTLPPISEESSAFP